VFGHVTIEEYLWFLANKKDHVCIMNQKSFM